MIKIRRSWQEGGYAEFCFLKSIDRRPSGRYNIVATRWSFIMPWEVMMGKETKDKILEAALVSFAENGYKGTNLRDFSAGMGLSKSALYSHYESKEAIWNALLDKMEGYYQERFGSREHLPPIPQSCEELGQLTMRMVDFTIHDEKIILTRKLLLTEQFHDERVKKLATQHFMDGTKEIFQSIFERMMENGTMKRVDADFLSLSYTAPITALIHLCDREPEKEAIIMEKVEAYIKQFIEVYGK